jgi:hypothetical protein
MGAKMREGGCRVVSALVAGEEAGAWYCRFSLDGSRCSIHQMHMAYTDDFIQLAILLLV